MANTAMKTTASFRKHHWTINYDQVQVQVNQNEACNSSTKWHGEVVQKRKCNSNQHDSTAPMQNRMECTGQRYNNGTITTVHIAVISYHYRSSNQNNQMETREMLNTDGQRGSSPGWTQILQRWPKYNTNQAKVNSKMIKVKAVDSKNIHAYEQVKIKAVTIKQPKYTITN